jgi:hypothetical protein
MRASFINATLALAASVSARTASDIDLGEKWYQVFTSITTKK